MGLQVENDEGKCEITEVSKVEGEASINNRKGKLIFFYEWNLKAKWKGEALTAVCCCRIAVMAVRVTVAVQISPFIYLLGSICKVCGC